MKLENTCDDVIFHVCISKERRMAGLAHISNITPKGSAFAEE